MHEYYCSRHIQAYIDLGWDCWVVERNGGEIAGSVEICYATEPEPFGRYAHLEILELSDELLDAEVEEWIIEKCESRARARGLHRFWCRPVGSGGSWEILARRGYVELWRNAWFTIQDLCRIQAPVYEERRLTGDYDREAAHLLALNHRESASYRWRYLWRPVLTPKASDFPTTISFSGRSMALSSKLPANVLVTVRTWRDPHSASADIWVDPDLAFDIEYVSDLISVAGGQASSMGASTMAVVVPEALSEGIGERFEALAVPLEKGDPWLMKGLGG
ncbi:MAG: hypothetical protein OXK79_01415 [Chloroflexota bacterium]|nr:hypothetical protein [Chloroflexota bacterium]